MTHCDQTYSRTEGTRPQKKFSFGHCPNYVLPSVSPSLSGNLYNLKGFQKEKLQSKDKIQAVAFLLPYCRSMPETKHYMVPLWCKLYSCCMEVTMIIPKETLIQIHINIYICPPETFIISQFSFADVYFGNFTFTPLRDCPHQSQRNFVEKNMPLFVFNFVELTISLPEIFDTLDLKVLLMT